MSNGSVSRILPFTPHKARSSRGAAAIAAAMRAVARRIERLPQVRLPAERVVGVGLYDWRVDARDHPAPGLDAAENTVLHYLLWKTRRAEVRAREALEEQWRVEDAARAESPALLQSAARLERLATLKPNAARAVHEFIETKLADAGDESNAENN
jgi:hypothetical protein